VVAERARVRRRSRPVEKCITWEIVPAESLWYLLRNSNTYLARSKLSISSMLSRQTSPSDTYSLRLSTYSMRMKAFVGTLS
jgi:hypothetical protein